MEELGDQCKVVFAGLLLGLSGKEWVYLALLPLCRLDCRFRLLEFRVEFLEKRL
jgi:hypothetical protein